MWSDSDLAGPMAVAMVGLHNGTLDYNKYSKG